MYFEEACGGSIHAIRKGDVEETQGNERNWRVGRRQSGWQNLILSHFFHSFDMIMTSRQSASLPLCHDMIGHVENRLCLGCGGGCMLVLEAQLLLLQSETLLQKI